MQFAIKKPKFQLASLSNLDIITENHHKTKNFTTENYHFLFRRNFASKPIFAIQPCVWINRLL